MPEFIADTVGTVAEKTWEDLSPFVQGYIECMLFTNVADGISMVEWSNAEVQHDVREGQAGGDIPGDAGFGDIHPDSLQSMIEDCEAFQTQQSYLLKEAYHGDYAEEQAGRDFLVHAERPWCRLLGPRPTEPLRRHRRRHRRRPRGLSQ